MKIKLAILEKDQSYLNRIVTVFNNKYADKLEIYSFTDQNIAMATLDNVRMDVLIADDIFDIDVSKLPQRCGFAYFVDSNDVDTINDQRVICKFQKAELIYKKILSIYAEKAGSVSGVKLGDESAKVIAFCSVGCGAGTSTMAAAAAVHLAEQNKKTLYLNLEKFASTDVFFAGEGQYDMSDIIFALKSKKTNLSLKLESCVKRDKRGVYFYSQVKTALDIQELNEEDTIRLISEARLIGAYNYIVLDMDFAMDKETLEILHHTNAVVWVSDGSTICNRKITNAYNALSILEQNAEDPLINRVSLVYNKFSNKISQMLENIGVKNVGGAPRYEHANDEQIVEQLSKMDMFDKII